MSLKSDPFDCASRALCFASGTYCQQPGCDNDRRCLAPAVNKHAQKLARATIDAYLECEYGTPSEVVIAL